MASTEYVLPRGLPSNVDAERAILGAIMLDNVAFTEAAQTLLPDDFSLDSHRRIYTRIMELQERGRTVDIITLTEELSKKKEVEAIGGVAYLASLTDGLPRRPSIEQYVRIVKDKALLRVLISVCTSAIERASDQSEEAVDILESTEAAVFQISERRIGQGFQRISQIVKGSFGTIDALYERGQRITGLETYFTDLDNMTAGLQSSDLIIIAARPSMGKTAFAMNIAENAAVMGGKTVGVFSLEMSKESLVLRMLCSQSRVDSHKLRTGFLGREDRNKLIQGLNVLAESKLYIDDTPGISLGEMRAKASRLFQQEGHLDLIVVDYLQLMTAFTPGSGKKYENRTQEVSAISRGLKALAKELKVPVVALSQLSRSPEARTGNNRPMLADLRESGAIEQDADVVAFIFREEVYKKDDPEIEGMAEIIIAKQRNGPTGTIRLAFRKSSTRFENLAEDFSDSHALPGGSGYPPALPN